MNMITIYGDFNCPYCYLASQRADLIIGLGLAAIMKLSSVERPAFT